LFVDLLGFFVGLGIGLAESLTVGCEDDFTVGRAVGLWIGLFDGGNDSLVDGLAEDSDLYIALYSKAIAFTYCPLLTCIPITRMFSSKTYDTDRPEPNDIADPIEADTDDDPEQDAAICPT
jgi:hypothetical protein